MNPFALALVTLASIIPQISNTETVPKNLNEQALTQVAQPNLTLMDGYDRYLVEPGLMLKEQRDA